MSWWPLRYWLRCKGRGAPHRCLPDCPIRADGSGRRLNGARTPAPFSANLCAAPDTAAVQSEARQPHIMTRHSKNSTAGAFFTAEERRKLGYGTQRQRLGRDSFRKPDACYICLQTARDPVVCADGGHLFCRECILAFILEQRQKLVAQRKAAEEGVAKRQADQQAELEQERNKRLAAFEASQSGRGVPSPTSGGEQQRRAPVLNAFWMPSKTPTASASPSAPPTKTTVTCPAGQHPISTKKLASLLWSQDAEGRCICKICMREISSITTGLVMWETCGHVACTKCHDRMTTKGGDDGSSSASSSCLICEKSSPKILSLAMDGTGFAESGGQVTASKAQPAFY